MYNSYLPLQKVIKTNSYDVELSNMLTFTQWFIEEYSFTRKAIEMKGDFSN